MYIKYKSHQFTYFNSMFSLRSNLDCFKSLCVTRSWHNCVCCICWSVSSTADILLVSAWICRPFNIYKGTPVAIMPVIGQDIAPTITPPSMPSFLYQPFVQYVQDLNHAPLVNFAPTNCGGILLRQSRILIPQQSAETSLLFSCAQV